MTAPGGRAPRLSELRWPQVRARLDAGSRSVVFAVASTEQHGPHLPLATDTIIGDHLADLIAGRLRDVLVAPTIHVGESTHHMAFPGTLSATKERLFSFVRTYVESLAHHGFEEILVFSSHGGNFTPLAELTPALDGTAAGTRVHTFTDLLGFIDRLVDIGLTDGISAGVNGGHAGESETSMMLALRPDLVDMPAAVEGYVGPNDQALLDRLWEGGTRAIDPNGVIGDGRLADAARGARYLEGLADLVAEHFERCRSSA